MRSRVYAALSALAFSLPLAAQKTCAPHVLDSEARLVAATRHGLLREAVHDDDPRITPEIANRLGALKQALAATAREAFTCSSTSISQQSMQELLARTLRANLAAEDTVRESPEGREAGIYGSDLGVQVFQLFETPRLFEVDFRYGIACGDDHLLMIFEAASDSASEDWKERLRWDTKVYRNVGDALGDFALMTPLTGDGKHPTWRFLVAHGHPGCAESPRPSRFDLDLLTPTADPDRPVVSWHFDHPYTQGSVVPHLATTEDTVEFQMAPPSAGSRGGAAPGGDPEEIFRFHLDSRGVLVPTAPPTASTTGAAPSAGAAAQAATSSPHGAPAGVPDSVPGPPP